jgi:hypothetical protein
LPTRFQFTTLRAAVVNNPPGAMARMPTGNYRLFIHILKLNASTHFAILPVHILRTGHTETTEKAGRMRRVSLVIVMCLGSVLLGCEANREPQRLLSVGDHAAPTIMQPPNNGQYTLYAAATNATGKTSRNTMITSLRLKRGDALGFRQRQSVVAATAELETPLVSAGGYSWVMQADTGQVDFVKTIVLIAVASRAEEKWVTTTLAALDSGGPKSSWRRSKAGKCCRRHTP